MARQIFTNDQIVEVYLDRTWQRGIVETGNEASSHGDYQFAGGYEVAVWVRGDRWWIRNDRRHIRPHHLETRLVEFRAFVGLVAQYCERATPYWYGESLRDHAHRLLEYKYA